ncbi:MAG TPA: hypothetical protein VLL77_12350, partial [Anaerolineales bacterium]|nr:hypothetical protein [Anaerolineales bacterium]
RSIARDVELVGGAIGGRAGAGMRRAAGRIAGAIERPQQMITSDLEQVKSEIGELGDAVDTLARAGRTPSAGAVIERMVVRPPGGSDDPAVEAVAVLISRLSVQDGSLKDQARSAIDAGFVARCVAIATAYRESLARLNGAELSATEAAAPCRALDPDQLIQEAEQTEVVESGTPAGDGTPVPASIAIVSADTSQANCWDSSVNSWTYCDVTIVFDVTFETPTLPADLVCHNFTSSQVLPLEVRRGSVSVSVTNEAKNVSVLGPQGWAKCEIVVGGVPVATDMLEE